MCDCEESEDALSRCPACAPLDDLDDRRGKGLGGVSDDVLSRDNVRDCAGVPGTGMGLHG